MALEPLPRFQRSDYAPLAERARSLLPRTQPDRRGWGKPCDQSTHATLTVTRPDNVRFGRPFRRELAPLVQLLLQGAGELGYWPRKNDEPGGGFSTYNCRDIRDRPGVMSMHAWNIAFDLNSLGNPRQRTTTGFRSTQPPWFVTLMESAGFYPGLRYPKADPMHFEYLGRPSDVAQDMENARKALAALRPPEEAVKPEDVKALQEFLNSIGARDHEGKPLVVDGDFGARTRAALANAGPKVAAMNAELLKAKTAAETATRAAQARGNALMAVATRSRETATQAEEAAK